MRSLKADKLKTISHKSIRDGLWYNGTHNFITAAKDGVWLYDIFDENPPKAKLITKGNFKAHKRFRGSDIFSLIQNPAEKSIIGYCMLDAHVGLIDVDTKKVNSFRFGKQNQFPLDFGFSPDGKILAASQNRIMLWDTKSGETVNASKIQNRGSPICWDSRGAILIFTDESGDILFFDLGKQTIIKSITGKYFDHECVKLRVSESYLVAIFVDGTIRLWNKQTLKLINEINTSKLFFNATIHHAGNFVVFWSSNVKPEIFKLPDFNLIYSFNEFASKVLVSDDKMAMIQDGSVDFFKMK